MSIIQIFQHIIWIHLVEVISWCTPLPLWLVERERDLVEGRKGRRKDGTDCESSKIALSFWVLLDIFQIHVHQIKEHCNTLKGQDDGLGGQILLKKRVLLLSRAFCGVITGKDSPLPPCLVLYEVACQSCLAFFVVVSADGPCFVDSQMRAGTVCLCFDNTSRSRQGH